MTKYKVLSTKKLEPSLLEKAKENNIEIQEQEFISIKSIWNKETYESLLHFAKGGLLDMAITSANAVDVLNMYMIAEDPLYILNWNFFCLSGKTKKAIQASRFLQKNIAGDGENALELSKKIIAAGINDIIFCCGNKRREELPAILKTAGIKVHEVILYETLESPKAVNAYFDAIIFFSPSGVQSFFSANELKKETICFSIGSTTTSSIKTFTSNRVITSLVPDPVELITEVIEYFKQRTTT